MPAPGMYRPASRARSWLHGDTLQSDNQLMASEQGRIPLLSDSSLPEATDDYVANPCRGPLARGSYWDEDGNYQDADSFGRDDLLYLARAAEKAFDYINGQLHQADEE
jgi:hypothetical protein